jgi:hypothetical protein
LEQRIARAWRKNQVRAVTVFNLVAQDTIEHRMLATLADKRGLADGVLDRLGDLSEIKLRTGRQALLARLEQVMLAGVTPPPRAKPSPPADPAADFVRAVAAAAGERLVVCEERYPAASDSAPVVVAVLERDAELWRPRLESLHADAWKHAPAEAPRLLVLDRATQVALDALAASGLVSVTTAATRRLHPAPEAAAPLSVEEQQRVEAHRALAARKLKVAQALLAAGLPEEAEPAARDTLHALGCALAVELRLPAPPDADACARHPWVGLFPAALQATLATPSLTANSRIDVAQLVPLLGEVK